MGRAAHDTDGLPEDVGAGTVTRRGGPVALRGGRPAAGLARTLALAAVAALLVAAPAAGGPIAHREVLPNGLVLLVAERPAVPIVAVRLLVDAGAVHDPADRAGLANLTGALLTRGTARRTATELDAAIEFVGGSLEAEAGRDGLTVSLAVLRRDLALGLDLLAEVVRAPAFPEAEARRLGAQIMAGIRRARDNPAQVGAHALARLVFPGHPYGVPVEGTEESVARLTREDVVGFHQRLVRPDTAIVAVVGAVTVDEARREILARFGNWAPPAAPAPGPLPAQSPPPPVVERVVRPELTQATLLLGRPAIRQTDPDYFALAVATHILGGSAASRLYGRVREEAGLAYSVYSYLAPRRHGASLVVGAQTRTAAVDRTLELVREELARLAREPVGERELALARSYLVGSFPLRLDTSAKVADFVVAVEALGLGLDYGDRYRERIAAVSAADVMRVAARFLGPDTFSRVVVGATP